MQDPDMNDVYVGYYHVLSMKEFVQESPIGILDPPVSSADA
jgi:hypothetical protein